MSYDHGAHNEGLCDHLLKQGTWSDWAITTAYYAAIQYADVILFPHVDGEEEYANIDAYYNRLPPFKRSYGKHAARIELAGKKLKYAKSALEALKELCHTARYYNWNMDQADARNAKVKLGIIKKACEDAARKSGISFGPLLPPASPPQ